MPSSRCGACSCAYDVAMLCAGLSLLNLSLDTLQPARFEQMTRRPAAGLRRVLDTLEHALDLGYHPVKVPNPCFSHTLHGSYDWPPSSTGRCTAARTISGTA